VAERLGPVRRVLPAFLIVAVLVGAAYELLVRDSTVAPRLVLPTATATIGSGPEAAAVGPDGAILEWLPVSEELQLPRLPLSTVPEKRRLGGPLLDQARVLGAAPAALRPYLESSYYGESGVDVVLRAGIELRFGDVSRLAEKWRAAAAVLADPSIESLDYVDLRAPRRASVGGSGHTLPAVP
jgi:Cell division protein FtsQ/DivIB, C-terminal